MPLVNENVTKKIPVGSKFQSGISNVDPGKVLEKGLTLPAAVDPNSSWVYFDCTIECMLDNGIVVHNRLPQVNNAPDTLASSLLGLDDPAFQAIAGPGVNLKGRDAYTDLVQRMGHSRYWFHIYGQALRFAYRIPIPAIKSIGGVPAIPYDKNPQMAFNRIAPGGNFGGVILWHAAWSLWYTTAQPPNSNTIPELDPSAHIKGDAPPPKSIQVPFSRPDDNAQPSRPATAPAAISAPGGKNLPPKRGR